MTTQSDIERVQVLIVGGGIVGLSASLFLIQQGVPSLLVERHRGTSIHPRARGINTRTAEVFREVGVLEEIRTVGAALSPAFGFLHGETLAEAIAPMERRKSKPNLFAMGSVEELSPTLGCRCTQDLLEPVLYETALARGGDLRFGTELVDFQQDDDGVTATIRERETGKTRTVRADYLIAADGANSPIRTKLAIPTTGRGSMGHMLNILVRVDLRTLVQDREFSICRIERPDMNALIVSIDNAERWAFHLVYRPAAGESPTDFPPSKCAELLRSALGLGDVPIEILGILPWEPTVRVATAFRNGRIFLAGDAAHQMPPWGGQGANTGVADAHNLAWKLAAVLRKDAPPTLLDSYDAERRPVGRYAAEKSGEMGGEYGMPDFRGLMKMSPEDLAWIQGFAGEYASTAVIPEECAETSDPDSQTFFGTPGVRAPHVWLEREGTRISTLDLFGRDFVLLAGPNGDAWQAAARDAASRTGLDLRVYRVGVDLADAARAWPKAAGIGDDGALLVRPDGITAWRARDSADASSLGAILSGVLGR